MLESILKRNKRRRIAWDKVQSLKEVLCTILSRLSARKLLSCRTLSSHWRSVIRSPELVKSQLAFSKEHPIFICTPYMGNVLVVYLIDADGSVLDQMTIPGCENLTCFCINSVGNGLVCFTNCPTVTKSKYFDDGYDNIDLEVRIVNPCSREVLKLPLGTPSFYFVAIGVAFGPAMTDFKVYRFFTPIPKAYSDGTVNMCEIYTLSLGAWKVIGRAPAAPAHDFATSVFVDEKVHWFISDDEIVPSGVMLVDRDDDFWVIELPVDLSGTNHSFLTELNGQLCVVGMYYDVMVMHIWLLKYKNMGYYWQDFHCTNIPYPSNNVTKAVSGRKNDFYVITSKQFFTYDIGGREWREHDQSRNFGIYFPAVFPFTPSLVPCNGVLGPNF